MSPGLMPPLVERLVLRDARVVDPAAGLDRVATVVIDRGTITRLTDKREPSDSYATPQSQVIDAQGMVVLPGLIDLRSHLGEPGYEYREDIQSGLKAASVGGYVRVCCLPDTKPVNDQRAVTEALLRAAAQVEGPTLCPIAAVTRGLQGTELAELGDLKEAGAVAVSDANHYIERSDVMRCALRYCRTFDLVLMQQAKDPRLVSHAQMHEGAISTRLGLRGWPAVAEEVGLFRDLALAEDTGARYHASTLSTHRAVNLVREAKARGVNVSCDVTPYHLLLSDRKLDGYDSRYKLEPPLRGARDQAALLDAIRDGTIDCVVSDHRPRSALETNAEFEAAKPGMSGLELCLSILWQAVSDGRLSLARMVEVLSTGPARVLGITAPSIQEGSLASLVLVNTSRRFVPRQIGMQSKSHNTPYLDNELAARVVLTIADGQCIYQSKDDL